MLKEGEVEGKLTPQRISCATCLASPQLTKKREEVM
jgi:hypothetical protein